MEACEIGGKLKRVTDSLVFGCGRRNRNEWIKRYKVKSTRLDVCLDVELGEG